MAVVGAPLAAFVGNSSWFGVLISLHVAGAIIGLGPTFAFGILGAMGKKATPEGGLALLEATLALENKLVNPILLTVQPATGALMIWNRGFNNDFFSGHRAWLMVGIIAYVVATIIALGIMDPTIHKMIVMARGGEGGTPAFGVLAARADRFGPILGILAVIIIVTMVWKPGSGCGALYRC
jgi:uncharacterized membrane protein